MRIQILLCITTCMLLSVLQNAKATETEPNDTVTKANVLALNGSNTGAINTATDIDWFKVTTNADGRLDVTISVSNNINLKCNIYDKDGVTLLGSGYTSIAQTISVDGLAPGTYFIKLYPYTAGQMPAYTLSDVLVQPTVANDVEPDSNKTQANTLPLNGSTTGHVGYYYNHYRDTADWFKVTTNADGLLRLTFTLTSGNSQYTKITLYDNDGATQISYNYGYPSFTLNTDGLAKGTFYIKVSGYYSSTYAAYTLADSLFPTQYNDLEPDSNKTQANVLPLNGSTTGHVGYLNNNYRDTADWFKVTTNADGLLRLTLTPTNGQNIKISLYDNDGATLISFASNYPTVTLNTDGLAKGTFYVKVSGYYPNSYAAYTLTDSLFPTQYNDMEPDSNKTQANVLPLNGSTTGHVGYLNNNYRDTADWFKVTTNADGLLRLTLTPTNGQNIKISLYDNDGATLISFASNYPTVTLNTDGLAKGTFYVKVSGYYPNSYAAYTLTDSLFPTQYNDMEPDSNKAQANVLPLNGSTTGHVGYLNNNYRDTADWFKVTTNADGLLRLTLTPTNGQNIKISLYDNDGATLISFASNYPTVTLNTDGLAKGTFYVKVSGYYPNSYAAYTLTDSLFTYTNAADSESNAKPYLAQTIPANTATPGHVGFLYNNTRDTTDWYKINYTGSGAMSVALNIELHKLSGAQYTNIQIYKDTTAAPIYNSSTTTSLTANLTALTQGYYWVKIFMSSNYQFESYALTPTFTQVNIAKLQVTSKVIAPDCSATNKLTLKCTGSLPPYTVQLFRYGLAYGSARIITNNSAFSFTNLPSGIYKVTAYGDGATGTAFSSVAVTFVPVPTALTATNITSTQAKLNWDTTGCVKYYSVQYRIVGTTSWTTKKTVGNKPFYLAKSLLSDTTYEWHVAPADSANGTSGLAPYSVSDTFTTAPAAMFITSASSQAAITANETLIVYPNPAATQFTIQLNALKATGFVWLLLRDMNGTTVWSRNNIFVSNVKGIQADVSKLATGMYILQITDNKNNVVAIKKVIVSR